MEANYASTPKHFTVAIMRKQEDDAKAYKNSDQILQGSMTQKEDNSS